MELFPKNGLLAVKLITWQDTTKLEATTGVWQLHHLHVMQVPLLHPQPPKPQLHPVTVKFLNGKEMVGVMMKTMLKVVTLMVETVVEITFKLPIVPFVNVLKTEELQLLPPQQ